MVANGLIRIYNLIITDGKVTKTQYFICHPSIAYADEAFETATQRIKFRHFTEQKSAASQLPVKQVPEKIATTSPFIQTDVLESITQLNSVLPEHSKVKSTLKFQKSIAKLRGLKPKFIRMRICHEILFFLIYGYKASGQPLKNDEVEKLFKNNCIILSEDDLRDMPDIYVNELSWRTFIPPLPHHKGWPTGWALLCDVILRMPISVFCKVYSVTMTEPELEEILNHPIKR